MEKNISDEMKVTHGSVMYDGWSQAGVHYLVIISQYMKEIKLQENNETISKNELAMQLLFVSPTAGDDRTVDVADFNTFSSTTGCVRNLCF